MMMKIEFIEIENIWSNKLQVRDVIL